MSENKKHDKGIGIENVEEALSRSEQFIENNQKKITNVVFVIILIIAAIMGSKKYYFTPKNIEAQEQLFYAEQYFQQDSFLLALNENGESNYYGFIDIMDEYKMTKAANLSRYYAGICYLKLGEYEEAIEYLKKFRKKDTYITSVAYGALGDVYSELEEYETAVSYYKKAADSKSNEFLSPLYLQKAGLVYQHLEEYDKMLDVFQKIKKEYPNSEEARNAEKYITIAELKINE